MHILTILFVTLITVAIPLPLAYFAFRTVGSLQILCGASALGVYVLGSANLFNMLIDRGQSYLSASLMILPVAMICGLMLAAVEIRAKDRSGTANHSAPYQK